MSLLTICRSILTVKRSQPQKPTKDNQAPRCWPGTHHGTKSQSHTARAPPAICYLFKKKIKKNPKATQLAHLLRQKRPTNMTIKKQQRPTNILMLKKNLTETAYLRLVTNVCCQRRGLAHLRFKRDLQSFKRDLKIYLRLVPNVYCQRRGLAPLRALH
jgi:hypothetical protein